MLLELLLCGLIMFLFHLCPFLRGLTVTGRDCLLGWKNADERLIKREKLLLILEFLESYYRELKAINRGIFVDRA